MKNALFRSLKKISVISVFSVVDNGDCLVTVQLPVSGHQAENDVIPAQAGIQTTGIAGVLAGKSDQPQRAQRAQR